MKEQTLPDGVFPLLASGLYNQAFCHTYKMSLEQIAFPDIALNFRPSSPLLMCDRQGRPLTQPSHLIPEHSQVLGTYFETVRWQGVCRKINLYFTSMQRVAFASEILIRKFSMAKTIPKCSNAKLRTGHSQLAGVAQSSPRGDVARSPSSPAEKLMCPHR